MCLDMSRWILWSIGGLAALLLTVGAADAQPPKPVRLFILSGQSNMAAMDPDVSFTPMLKEAFVHDDVVVVKHAVNGQLIRMWYKDWQAPEGAQVKGKGRNGRHYDTLLAAVKEALAGKPRPASVTFVWMQGEADANHQGYAERYEKSLHGILAQLQTDLNRKDIDFVLGRISDYGVDQTEDRPGWNIIRQAQVKFAQEDPKTRAWVDTDDLNGEHNGLHYSKEGYQKLGERFAQRAIELIQARR
ncbi:MAG: sialate O-acetylesterase [Phycisphaeraceae bacterium]